MRRRRLWLAGLLALGSLAGLPARADAAPAATGSADGASDPGLREMIEKLEREVALLRRKLEVQEEASAAKGPQPTLGAGPDGFFLRSADRAYELKLRGYTHFDGRFYAEEDGDYTDTWLFRRVRPMLEGTLGGVVDFRIMPDFAGSQLSLQDAYANFRYFPLANLQLGKYKAPFGIERLQSANALLFAERALPTQLVPNRDLGVMLHGVLGEGFLQYQLAFMNGVIDGGSADTDNGDGKDLVGRISLQPFQNRTEGWLSGLGVGAAINYGNQDSPGTPPVYRTAGQSTFFAYVSGTQLDDDRFRYSPQLTWYWGPFGLLGEYVSAKTGVTRPGAGEQEYRNQAWQVAAHYVLTGENATYKGVMPRESFSVEKRTFGAFEIAARYNELRIDPDAFDDGYASALVSASRARAWGAGVNWYLNRWVRFMADYEQTFFQDGGGGTIGNVGDRDDEKVFFFRTQLSF